jgi:hypothetical protein
MEHPISKHPRRLQATLDNTLYFLFFKYINRAVEIKYEIEKE